MRQLSASSSVLCTRVDLKDECTIQGMSRSLDVREALNLDGLCSFTPGENCRHQHLRTGKTHVPTPAQSIARFDPPANETHKESRHAAHKNRRLLGTYDIDRCISRTHSPQPSTATLPPSTSTHKRTWHSASATALTSFRPTLLLQHANVHVFDAPHIPHEERPEAF